MRRILFVLLVAASTALFAEEGQTTAPAANEDSYADPIQRQDLGLDPTRLTTHATAGAEYVNRANGITDLSLYGGGLYRFSFMDDNRARWGATASAPLTYHKHGKQDYAKLVDENVVGLGDIKLGVSRIFPTCNLRQVAFLNTSWGTLIDSPLKSRTNVLSPGYGLSYTINDSLQLVGTATYSFDIGRPGHDPAIQRLDFNPGVIYGLNDIWFLKGEFLLGYNMGDTGRQDLIGTLGALFIPVEKDTIRMVPAITGGRVFGEDREWVGTLRLELPFDKYSAHQETYRLTFGASYFFR